MENLSKSQNLMLEKYQPLDPRTLNISTNKTYKEAYISYYILKDEYHATYIWSNGLTTCYMKMIPTFPLKNEIMICIQLLNN